MPSKTPPKTPPKPKRKAAAKPGSRASARRRSGARPRPRGRVPRASAAAAVLEPQARIFAAIDETSLARAAALQSRLQPHVGGFKLGPVFLNGRGPDLVRELFGEMPLFLDLKLHDIPNTVALSVRRLYAYRPQVLTVHAAGGLEMMRAAAEAAQEQSVLSGIPRPAIAAITVLTSLSEEDLHATGVAGPLQDQVLRLTELAWRAGLDGVVAAPRDVAAIRARFGRRLMLYTPGIRPRSKSADDHKRSMTPERAVAEGADFLVVGRPLTGAPDPAAAARRLLQSLQRNT